MKKIILSGGWGYGNLGDDAILLSSIHLIRDSIGQCDITVLTYNVDETLAILKNEDNVQVRQSLHSTIFGLSPYGKFDISNSILSKIQRRFEPSEMQNNKRILREVLREGETSLRKDDISYFNEICKGADLYIMSGGGYILDWAESLASKYYEILLAKKNSLDCICIGQTVGPFLIREADIVANNLYKLADSCFFRDVESIKEVKKWGIPCTNEPIPDIALYDRFESEKLNRVVYIPFHVETGTSLEPIVNNLQSINKQLGYPITIALSQLWIRQFKIATDIYFQLLSRGVDVRFFVPHDMLELQNYLAKTRFVISQNLHGLIMSYRAGSNIITTNTRRKFRTFMDITGLNDYLIPMEKLTNTGLLNLLSDQHCNQDNKTLEFSKKIKECFMNTLSNLNSYQK